MLKKMMFLAIAALATLSPATLAGHDEGRFRPANRAVVLADDLLDATRDLRFEVNRRGNGRHGRTGQLIFALDRLGNQARELRIDLVRGVSPRRLDERMERVVNAFNRVDREMSVVRSGRLQREFDQVGFTMRALIRNVEIATGPRPRPDRRGVHGSIVLGDRGGDYGYNIRIRF